MSPSVYPSPILRCGDSTFCTRRRKEKNLFDRLFCLELRRKVLTRKSFEIRYSRECFHTLQEAKFTFWSDALVGKKLLQIRKADKKAILPIACLSF